jgi:Zn ribbon nucleic-acid-binding protein
MSTSRWLAWTPKDSIIEKVSRHEPSKPSEVIFEGFAGAALGVSRKIEQSSFPHCPRCASFALYRKNNVGKYECQTCKLQDIDETAARRLQ